MTRYLLLGGGGLLGQAMLARLDGTAVRADRAALDVRDPTRVMRLVADAGVDAVINCAAHTDVDGAESNPAQAFAVNAVLPGLVAAACRRAGIPLLHFGSTGCYGDWKDEPYRDDDPLCPTTVHHRSKADGEAAVRNAGCEHLILRLGWLFGGAPGQRKNFVWNRLVEAAGKTRMESDPGQVGVPTDVADVAGHAARILDGGVRGTFNLVSHGSARRVEYVERIVQASGLPCTVVPAAARFDRPARVSPNEAAINFRLGLMGLDRMPHWTDAVDRFVASLPVHRLSKTGTQ